MIRHGRHRMAWRWMAVAVGGFAGCAPHPAGRSRLIKSPVLGPMTIAVAPALNLSGSSEFDPERFADIMASELTYVEGIDVVPVSRVLGVLNAQGLDAVRSADHAWELRNVLGVDAVLVFAVIEYDPYDPPTIGIDAQLFGRPRATASSLDPVAQSRRARLVAPVPSGRSGGVLASVQRTFSAAHENVVRDLRRFAARRDGDDNPYGWRRYMVSQQSYIRFCCHETLKALISSANQ